MSSIFSFFGCKENTQVSRQELRYPPFRIEKRNVTDRQYKPNEGTTTTHLYTKYNLYYDDKLISFPAALDENTGVSGIWKAYYLKDGPTPTLLVASKNVYLVNEVNHSINLIPIANIGSNYSSIQWLDADNGQPGPKTQILIGEDSTDCILQGGTFLLVNQSNVIRINDLMIFPFKHNADMSLGYTPYQVLAFSPDQREIAFMGSKSDDTNPTQFIHAVIVLDFETNDAYTIPFNKTKTRLHQPYEADAHWLKTYFEWIQVDSGHFKLIEKNLNQPIAWQGYFTKNDNYELAPVMKEMHSNFVRFIINYLEINESDVKAEAYGNLEKFTISYLGHIFDITYLNNLNTVSLSSSFMNKGSEVDARKLILKVGGAFNEELKKENLQLLFTSY